MAPSCKICRDHYAAGGKEPRSLPCGHSFCTQCLTQVQRTTNTLKCPTCKTNHNVNVGSLPINYDLMSASAASMSYVSTGPGASMAPANTTVAPSGVIAVIVKDLMDQVFRVQINPTATIGQLKQILQKQYGIDPNNCRLLYCGRRLEDNQTLQSYNITNGTVIQMSTAYVGGKENCKE